MNAISTGLTAGVPWVDPKGLEVEVLGEGMAHTSGESSGVIDTRSQHVQYLEQCNLEVTNCLLLEFSIEYSQTTVDHGNRNL